jgi:hypothetical protein
MKVVSKHQSVAQQPLGQLPARSDAITDRMSEEIARRTACETQKP